MGLPLILLSAGFPLTALFQILCKVPENRNDYEMRKSEVITN